MLKSKFYKDIKAGKTTMEELAKSNAMYRHRNGTIEYIYTYDWSGYWGQKAKKSNPNLADYDIYALTDNGEVICRGRCLTEGKYEGYFRWMIADDKEKALWGKLNS